jgi:hypothetical protein
MQSLTSLFKLLFVFTFLIGILCLAFFAFFVLLGLACAVSIMLWAKTLWTRRTQSHTEYTTHTTAFDEALGDGVIIEGEVIEKKQED